MHINTNMHIQLSCSLITCFLLYYCVSFHQECTYETHSGDPFHNKSTIILLLMTANRFVAKVAAALC